MKDQLRRQSGFSMVEMLIVIIIIMLLAVVGAGLYTQYRRAERVRTVALQIEGLIMEAQSRAVSSQSRDIIGYLVKVDNSQATLFRLKLNNPRDDFEPGTINLNEITREEVKDPIKFGKWVKKDYFGFANNHDLALANITAVAPSGRLLFNNREPDLNQSGTSPKDNLYNPLALSPWRNEYNIGMLRLSLKITGPDLLQYIRVIRIDGESGKVEILGD